MAFTLPAPQALHTSAGSDNVGTLGALGSLGTKSGGNLPITTNASQSLNTTASNATGTPAGILFGINGQSATTTVDGTAEAMVLVWSLQYNAPNRIQSSSLANGGSRFRLGSGSSPTLNYKDYYVGGNDTPFCSSQAGPVTMCIDISDTSHNSEVGTFDLSEVSAYGHASVRFNLVGSSTTQTFFQRSFLFTTTKNSANIPKFTGVSSFDDAVETLQGTDYTTKIGSWVTKSGSSVFLPCPFQIGDGASSTNFDDSGAAVVSPGSNLAGQENFRLTNDAMRVYANLRDSILDSITLSGSYSWGTSASWDFNVSNSSSINIGGATFSGMGDFLVGSSVSGAATFNLRSGSAVKIEGAADLSGSTISGDCELAVGTLTTLDSITVTGAFDFKVAGTYTAEGCVLNEVTNSSGGSVTIVSDNSAISTVTGPNITIVSPPTDLTLVGLQPNSEVRIYGSGGTTELAGTENSGTNFTASISASSVDIIIHSLGYEYQRIDGADTSSDLTLPIQQRADRNYRNP